LTAVGFAIGGNPIAPAALATPWNFVTALAIHLKQREAVKSHDIPVSLGRRNRPVAGQALSP